MPPPWPAGCSRRPAGAQADWPRQALACALLSLTACCVYTTCSGAQGNNLAACVTSGRPRHRLRDATLQRALPKQGLESRRGGVCRMLTTTMRFRCNPVEVQDACQNQSVLFPSSHASIHQRPATCPARRASVHSNLRVLFQAIARGGRLPPPAVIARVGPGLRPTSYHRGHPTGCDSTGAIAFGKLFLLQDACAHGRECHGQTLAFNSSGAMVRSVRFSCYITHFSSVLPGFHGSLLLLAGSRFRLHGCASIEDLCPRRFSQYWPVLVLNGDALDEMRSWHRSVSLLRAQ